MSHVTTLKGVTLNDEAAIARAVERLNERGINCSLGTNKRPRVHGYDDAPVCDYVLELPGCQYDLGLRKNKDGQYEPVFDTYQNQVGSQIGAVCPVPGTPGAEQQRQMGQFLQLYAEEAARNQMTDQGFLVEDVWTDEKSGEVTMVFAEL